MVTPLVLYSGFLDKTNFPRILTHGSGTHRTLLQYPHGPVPEHYLALLVCTAAGGPRHSFPVPIYPLGLDETNFPRIQENIFILSSGRNKVYVARYASHYFSKGAICVPLDDQEKNIYTLSSHRATRELYAKVPSHRAPVGGVCEGGMLIELRSELYAKGALCGSTVLSLASNVG